MKIKLFKKSIFIIIVIFIISSFDIWSQSFEFSLVQRRRYNQIYVEIWGRNTSGDSSSMHLGNSTLILQYNSDYLKPATTQYLNTTDTVNSDLDKPYPIDSITSKFNSANGYNALTSQKYSTNYYSLEVNQTTLGSGGMGLSTNGRGSFIGKIIFDISGNPDLTATTDIKWSQATQYATIQIFDSYGNNIQANTLFDTPSDLTIVGVTILSPTVNGSVINLGKDYSSLTGVYASGGYPIYFERSINPTTYKTPSGSPPAMNENLDYSLEYSLDGGSTWESIGRVAETDRAANGISGNMKYLSGNIFAPNSSSGYTITDEFGNRLSTSNYRNPVRVIWEKNPYFTERSENAKIRITILDTTTKSDITLRDTTSIYNEPVATFILGRIFFSQLNGTNQYFKTKNNYSNSTQLTVEAWINLNANQGSTAQTGIIASSGGSGATPILGSNEGAWMLYLKNGNIPAFRVREIQNRGTNGYLANLVAYSNDTLIAQSSSLPLSELHAGNWTHLAATVADNVVTLYVNGEIVAQETNFQENDMRMMLTNHPIWVGINPNGTIDSTHYLNAGIKQISVWRTALTQAQLRSFASGIATPSNVSTYGDVRRALQIYYSFNGVSSDIANNSTYQNGSDTINFYSKDVISNSNIIYRVDKPHIKITSPSIGSGLSNLQGKVNEIRWLSYGLGDITKSSSKDLAVQYTTDGGTNWVFAKDSSGNNLDSSFALDAESTTALWEPYENSNTIANLRTITPYSRTTQLKISGRNIYNQNDINWTTATFTVAPYFSIRRTPGTILRVDNSNLLNITGNIAFIEAWIKPYRFPTTTEKYFTILSKADDSSGTNHYALRLLSTGQIQLRLTDTAKKEHIINSDTLLPLVRPNSVSPDTAWSHIAVYIYLNNGTGKIDVRFFVNGTPQLDTNVTKQFDTISALVTNNNYPFYIGNDSPANTASGFIGEMREIRFWNGLPNNYSSAGIEPTPLTLFVQGGSTINAEDLPLTYRGNLITVFSMNGGTFFGNGWIRTTKTINSNIVIRNFGEQPQFHALEPYINVIEPIYKQRVANSKTDLRIRWIGFLYDGNKFYAGDKTNPPAIEYSIQGGGGTSMQPYQYVTSIFNNAAKNTLSFPDSVNYRINLTGSSVWFATKLDVSQADPDYNNDGLLTDPGPISAALTNARFRLTGQYTYFSETKKISNEGPLFSITPPSNFTVRVLLEGHHNGSSSGYSMRNIGTSYAKGGLKIKLFRDNNGTPGTLVDSAESTDGYANLSPANRNSGTKTFANVNFVFSDLADGNYWVKAEQINHLPILSRFPAIFKFSGDVSSTWAIESGWDFSSWNGVDNNVLPYDTTNPWSKYYYTAYGNAINTKTTDGYSTTGLIFNNGLAGTSANSMAAMVGGDVVNDGVINAADRVRVRLDEGTSIASSDVTGDGYVNADDRTIVDRNYGKVSSLYNITLSALLAKKELDDENNSNKIKKINSQEQLLSKGSISYEVSAVSKINGNYVDLSMYIKNTGDTFNLANASFAVTYNSNNLKYNSLVGSDSVIFSNDTSKGYSKIVSAPLPNAVNPLPDVRTIEVDYDATDSYIGKPVPMTSTYLGTLRFNIKSKTGVVAFNWHASTSVHATDSSVITEYGTFDTIPPILFYSAKVTSPNGGESYQPKSTTKITWTSTDSSYIYIQFSSNSGSSWTNVTSDSVKASSRNYSYQLPDINSSNCLIRLIDAVTSVELDRSDAVFSIADAYARIIEPSADDAVYTGGKNMKITWICQGCSKIYFEFSSDGGTKWTKITSLIAPLDSSANWIVAPITTKSGVIRMICNDDTTELARSGLFRILSGSMSFNKPRSNEILKPSSTDRVTWTSKGISSFDLQFSSNSGKTWTDVKSGIIAMTGYYDWTVANVETETALLRALWDNDPDMEYARTSIFEIRGSLASVESNNYNSRQFQIYPNPNDGNFSISINLLQQSNISIKIKNMLGEEVYSENRNCSFGENTINIKLNNLATGLYYIIINDDNNNYCQSFVVSL